MKELVDPSLGDDYDRDQMDRLVLTASLCVEHSPLLRPCMSQASLVIIVIIWNESHIWEVSDYKAHYKALKVLHPKS